MALPPVQRAVVVVAQNDARCLSDRPVPTIQPHHILVRVVCVALNPADWRHVDYHPVPGAILGFDYSGIVESVGEGVTRFKQGDAVCGIAHGGNALRLEDGAFAEYILVKEHVQMHKPANLSFQEAATIGVGFQTIGLALYHHLKLNLPADPVRGEDSPFVFVYGGSTASGSLAIQLLKLSGYRVATTCSPHNFGFVKSLGADVVCDYKDPEVGHTVRAAVDGSVQIALDTIATESTAQICADVLSPDGGGIYMALLPVIAPRDNVKSMLVLGYTIMGEDFVLGAHKFPAVPADKEFAAGWTQTVQGLLDDGSIKVHPPLVCEGGLEGIPDGFNLLRKEAVSGKKLVYQVSAEPK